MASYSLQYLSGSTTGLPVPVAATATPGTLIHTAITGSGAFDKLYLFVSNVTASSATLTVEWGGVTDPANHLVKGLSVPANSGPTQIAFGQVLGNGVAVRAFSGTASALNITGEVLRAQ